METITGSVIVGVVLAAIIFFIIRKMIKDRKKGKSSCGCDCASCGGACHCKDN